MTGTAHADRFVLDGLPAPHLLPEFRFDLPELSYPERLNAAAVLIDGGDPDAFAVVNDAVAWTRGELRDRSDRIAAVLTEEGLIPGNRVLLRGPDTATMIACWLGVLKAGGVAVATMPMLRAAELAPIIARAQVSHALLDARTAGELADAPLRSVVTYDGDRGGEQEARIARARPAPPVDTRADDPALIAFTSGTTGVPKGCVHLHRDVLAPADSFARHILRPEPGWRWACSAPLAFTFGLGQKLIFPLRFGGVAVACEEAGAKAILDLIERRGVNLIATAPTAYKAMLPLLPGRDLTSLRACVSAGYNIAAPEVEEALLAHPAVAECAVVGAPCPERGRRVRAFVVAAAGHPPSPTLAAELQAHVKALIAPYKYPRDVLFVAALPHTPTGKLRRAALRDASAEERARMFGEPRA